MLFDSGMPRAIIDALELEGSHLASAIVVAESSQ